MKNDETETCLGAPLSLADGRITLVDLGEEGIKTIFKDGRPEELCEDWAFHLGPSETKLLSEWLRKTDILRGE